MGHPGAVPVPTLPEVPEGEPEQPAEEEEEEDHLPDVPLEVSRHLKKNGEDIKFPPPPEIILIKSLLKIGEDSNICMKIVYL